MDENELKGLLQNRLYLELQLFKDSMLLKDKEDIYKESYKIEIYVNLYEIFKEHAGSLKKDTVRGLLNLNSGILEFIYQEWLGVEDNFYEELKACACSSLETVSRQGSRNCGCGKEDENGTESDKAA